MHSITHNEYEEGDFEKIINEAKHIQEMKLSINEPVNKNIEIIPSVTLRQFEKAAKRVEKHFGKQRIISTKDQKTLNSLNDRDLTEEDINNVMALSREPPSAVTKLVQYLKPTQPM